ncbi:hypothetical protein [Klebsiella pneumoniae]|uniref:hypothetical protein n=1 Tax=Klebsiella pneumoniae TaxID=573 RepID=UPI000D19F13F|nr:hypothetical protein [Klebsiella pneumoniae]
MLSDYQVFAYRDLIIEPREMRALYNALNTRLGDVGGNEGHLLTLDLPTLSERLRASQEEIIYVSTNSFWGFWKCITRNEIVWELTRVQAIKLRALLGREVEKKRKSALVVTERLLSCLPIV